MAVIVFYIHENPEAALPAWFISGVHRPAKIAKPHPGNTGSYIPSQEDI